MIRFFLDEHFPHALVKRLNEYQVDAVCILVDHPELLGATDAKVLETATSLGYVMVTEDVSTFPIAIRSFSNHIGVVYCRSAVFSRSTSGLDRIARALSLLAHDPPNGLGELPVVWWLQDDSSQV